MRSRFRHILRHSLPGAARPPRLRHVPQLVIRHHSAREGTAEEHGLPPKASARKGRPILACLASQASRGQESSVPSELRRTRPAGWKVYRGLELAPAHRTVLGAGGQLGGRDGSGPGLPPQPAHSASDPRFGRQTVNSFVAKSSLGLSSESTREVGAHSNSRDCKDPRKVAGPWLSQGTTSQSLSALVTC